MEARNFNFEIIKVTQFRQNCAVIWDKNKNGAILDPGGDKELIENFIEERGIHPVSVILTHGHLDHVGAAPYFKEKYNIPIIGCSIEEKIVLDNLENSCIKYDFPVTKCFYPDQFLREGDKLNIGDLEANILEIPGHSPGHIGFYFKDYNIVFSGDALFEGTIGRTDLLGSNHNQLIESVMNKLFILPEDTRVMPGHGRDTTIRAEKRSNPYFTKEYLNFIKK
ncbi:MAG: MBL fold metallo-hydrolase [Psittacicella sp.]